MFSKLIKTTHLRWPWTANPFVWFSSVLVFFNFFVNTIASTFVGSVFLTVYGAHSLPYLYVTQAILMFLIAYITSSILTQNPRHFIIYTHFIAIVLLIAGQYFLKQHLFWLPFVICLVTWSVAQLYSINTGNFLSSLFNIRQFKEYYSIFTSFGTLLGALFSFLLPLFIHHIGVNNLPFIIIALLVLGFPIFRYLKLQPFASTPHKKQVHVKVQRYPLYRNLLFYLAMVIIMTTLVDYCFKFALNLAYHGNGIANFIAIFSAIVSISVFLFQIAVTKKLIRLFGVVSLLLVLPAITILAALGTLSYPSLITVTILAFVNTVSVYSMSNISRDIILNILPAAIRLKGKTLIKGLTVTVGTLVASGVVWVVSHYFGVSGVKVTLLILSTIAFILAWRLRKYYKNTLRDQLILKRFKPEQILSDYSDPKLLKNLVQTTLQSNDINLNFLGFSMLQTAEFSILPKEVLKFITAPDIELRIQAIKATELVQDPSVLKVLTQRIECVEDGLERFHLLNAINQQDTHVALNYAKQFIHSHYPPLRACAIDIQMKQGDIKDVAYAINLLRDMIEARDPLARASSAEILGHLHVGDLTHELEQLVKDPTDVVALNAIRSVSKLHKDKIIPTLVERLDKGLIGLSASKALENFGTIALPALQEKVFSEKSINACKLAIKTIASIEGIEAELALMTISSIKNLVLLHQIAKNSAYRAQKFEISAHFLKHAENMLHQTLHTVTLLQVALARYPDEFYQREITARLHLVQKSFLYWLAILNNPVELIPIVASLCANADHNNLSGFHYALELLETSLKHGKYSLAINQVFENTKPPHFEGDFLQELINIDSWLHKILSTSLKMHEKSDIDTLHIAMTLRHTHLFENLPGEALLAIADRTQFRHVLPYEILYTQGEMPNAIYIVSKGECQLIKNNKTVLKLKAYDCFGFISVFENVPWDMTAETLTEGTLLSIEKEEFHHILDDIPEVRQAMMYVILGYLKESLNKNFLPQ